LHVGGARTALYNYLYARAQGGVFVLRIEDTDAERSTDASVDAILNGMRWLGLAWDEGPGVGGPHGPYLQSQRRALYEKAAADLRARDSAYPCFCTAEELEQRRAAQAERGEAPRYDGQCRHLSAQERADREAAGTPFALRFALPGAGEIAWDDVVRGRIVFQNEVLDDFVLVRSDGLPTYNFACVVDDLDMRITHVLRGDDHISNTPRQLLIYAALGSEPPVFAHASMILGPDGKRLSKRHGATSVEAFGDLGILPEGMVNFLALLGWAYDGKQELFSLSELERIFDIARIVPSPAVFNTEKLEWMNAQHLKALAPEERERRVVAFLAQRGHDLSARTSEWISVFVRALGDRIKTLVDAETYGAFALHEEVAFDADAWADLLNKEEAGPRLEQLAQVLAALPVAGLGELEAATRGLAAEAGIKPGELMGLARVALTGRKVAPGIFEVMWLLGPQRTLARLRSAAARWASERASA
jgi:glutamyl-tRNA synthetase